MTYRLLFFCLFFIPLSTQLLAQTNTKKLALADTLVKQQKFKQAIFYYTQLIGSNNKNDQYYQKRGYAYLKLGNAPKSVADYQKALKINPACTECYTYLAYVKASVGKLNQADSLLAIAIQKDDKSAVTYYIKGRVNDEKKDNFTALFAYNKAIELNPNNAYYYAYRGKTNLAIGQQYAGLSDFNKAVKLAPNNVNIIGMRARFFTETKQWQKALDDLNKCIKLSPKEAQYYQEKGTVLGGINRFKEAIQALNQSLKLDNTQYLAYLYRGRSHYRLENMNQACADFLKAKTFAKRQGAGNDIHQFLDSQIDNICDTQKKSYYYQRGIAAYNQKKYLISIQLYNQGLAKFPKSPLILSFRGNAYRALRKYDAAVADYLKSLSDKALMLQEITKKLVGKMPKQYLDTYQDISAAATYGSIAECYISLNKYQKAIAYADSSTVLMIQHKNQNPEIAQGLSSNANIKGLALDMLGKYKLAKKSFANAIAFNTNNAWAHANLARTLLNEISTKQTKGRTLKIQINTSPMNSIGVTLPILSSQTKATEALTQALQECNRAVSINNKLAYVYLMRAYIKILLKSPDYCVDVLTAEELGIGNMQQKLGIVCK